MLLETEMIEERDHVAGRDIAAVERGVVGLITSAVTTEVETDDLEPPSGERIDPAARTEVAGEADRRPVKHHDGMA